MSNIILDHIEYQRHVDFLRKHGSDTQFPLDGSDWARLVAERMHRDMHPSCHCGACKNFLTRLHSIESPLRHERKETYKSIYHWVLPFIPN